MRANDLSPFYRSTIGFERMLDLLSATGRTEAPQESWPAYDIERLGEDRYRITMAIAGFSRDELTIMTEANVLLVEGRKSDDDSKRKYLHRGISQQAFQRSGFGAEIDISVCFEGKAAETIPFRFELPIAFVWELLHQTCFHWLGVERQSKRRH